jgi:ferredoxin
MSMSTTRSISIDRTKCMGSGNCAVFAAGVFDLDAANIAYVLDPDAASEAELLTAERLCPTGAISVSIVAADHQ